VSPKFEFGFTRIPPVAATLLSESLFNNYTAVLQYSLVTLYLCPPTTHMPFQISLYKHTVVYY